MAHDLQATSNVPLRHVPSPSCLTGALRDALAAGGLSLGDEMVFGLGAGLFFGYGGQLQTRYFDAAVQAPWLEACVFANLGLHYCRYEVADAALAFARLLALLDQGRAVPVLINAQACPSLLATVEPALVEFLPAHWIVVSGYDPARAEVTFYDNRHFGPVRLGREAFQAARHAGRGARNPFGAWLELEFDDPLPLADGVWLALRQTARALSGIEALHVKGAAGFHVGLDALRRFARQVPSYARLMSRPELALTALRLRTSLTVAGAAKDALRGLYARFLDGAARLTELPELTQAASAYRASARVWQRLDLAWRDVAAAPERLDEALDGPAIQALLRDLVEAEKRALQALEQALEARAARRPETVGGRRG